jgi:ubiquitin conjugation factor E4 B
MKQAVFYGVLPYANDRHGILGHTLNTHAVALKNLIPALTHFYIGMSCRQKLDERCS